jgi:hypothetical protein
MKNFITLALILISAQAVAATAPFDRVQKDKLKVGSGNATSKSLEFDVGLGVLNPTLGTNSTGTQINATPNTLKVGDGTTSDKSITLDIGLGSANPKMKWSTADSKLEFANDGTNFSGFGSGSGGSGGTNLLPNSDFESGLASWTSSGGTFTAVTTGANLLNGLKSALWTPSAANQTLTSTQVTVPAGLTGGGCMGKAFYKTAEATNLYMLQAIDGSSNVLGSATVYPTLGSSASTAQVYFPCPTSGTIALRVVAAGTIPGAAIAVDDLHIGSLLNGSQVSQASLYGTASTPGTSGCQWTSTSGTFANLPANGSCPTPSVTGNASAPATKIPGVTFATLPPGEYFVEFEGSFYGGAGTGNPSTYVISDGTTSKGLAQPNTTQHADHISGNFSYNTAQSNVTFQVQCYRDDTNCTVDAGATSNRKLEIRVYRFPTSSETAYRTDSVAASWSGYHDQCNFPSTSVSFADPTSDATSGCVLTTLPGRSVNFGSVTSYLSGSARLPGIVFTAPRLGSYQVCSTFQITIPNSGRTSVRMVDSSGAEINQTWVSSVAGEQSGSICGNTQVTSLSPWTVKLQTANTVGASNYISAAASISRTVTWSVRQLDGPGAMPVFPGNISSNTAGMEHLERAVIQNNGSCSILTQSGNWITSVVHGGSAGNCVLTIVGFSGRPSCFIEGESAAVNFVGHRLDPAPTSSSISVVTTNTGGAGFDSNFGIACMGPR